MALETSFTRLVGCQVPLQQAGMGGVAGTDLAAAVADAGALGMLGTLAPSSDLVVKVLEDLASRTGGAFGVNFLVPFLDLPSVEVAAARARVVEFFYGDPDPALVARGHEGGALVSWQVGSLHEARAAADAGCDIVVAQGIEAGGHVRGEVGLLSLLDQVVPALEVPVVAAGGIGSARSVAAVLAAGAAGARVGTRFLAAREADVHPDYLRAVIDARPQDTVLTTTFSLLWPDAPHRVLRSCVEAAEAASGESVGEVELPGNVRFQVPRLSALLPGRSATGQIGAMALYAGQSVGQVQAEQLAADIVRELTQGAEELLKGLAGAAPGT